MEYNFREIEKKWQKFWTDSEIYKVENDSDKPAYYVLDMFPYPSGAGLHVGHPLGYIASDIFARYKRLKGFNVLHPMGFDSFGLPAEQYALETGQHPAVTTKNNIATFKEQLGKIGFCFDWSREVKTSDPDYYRWTQWIFLKLFHSWYNPTNDKAESLDTLIQLLENTGAADIPGETDSSFTDEEWKSFSPKQQADFLMEYRLAYSSTGEVNWCEALGTVLANDEVINGVSERGGHTVEKKKMRQWYLRITAYADRLLKGLETVEFSEAMKEMQRNWIGRSEGAEIEFALTPACPVGRGEALALSLKAYTTRPDTIFGVDFMVLAPEHELVQKITTAEQQPAITKYLEYVKSRSDRERLSEVKQITGCFTGAYALNPFNGKKIPVWIAEYVLSGYGTGAIMAVPCGDQRDFDFARHFDIPITNIIGKDFDGESANPTKDAILENSEFLNGRVMHEVMSEVIDKLVEMGIGRRKVNYRMRDAGFSRQRYWGEPFPIVWVDGIAIPLDEDELPLELPHVDTYGPGKDGEGPLANLREWILTPNPSPRERGEEPAYVTSKGSTWKELKPYARENRKEQTVAEKLLWANLRNRNINNCKFRRQHAIEGFIVDFVCIERSLVIEVDGGYHMDEEQKKYDQLRTEFLNESGFTEIRFSNEDIEKDMHFSLLKIREYLAKDVSPLLGRGVRGEVKTGVRETSTMPGYAGSSWYFLRYMDPQNDQTFADRKATDYWNQVDVYVGGTEHAVGHLLYSRMWTKFLYDLGLIGFEEPYKKLVNQGMIQGSSRFVYRAGLALKDKSKTLIHNPILFSKKYYVDFIDRKLLGNELIPLSIHNSEDLKKYNKDEINWVTFGEIRVDVNIVDGEELDIEAFKKSKPEYANAEFILEDGKYICGVETEKMSKSKYNTVNPNDLVDKYGADTFRMYEMFLGPVEQSKPWNTQGIEGVHRFLKKLWRLFYDDSSPLSGRRGAGPACPVGRGEASPAELKTLHKTIKKIEEDTERFSFNTSVSAFMVCVNELTDLKCHKKAILEPLLILLAPYAPHIAEELYHALGNSASVLDAVYPKLEEKYLKESEKEYPVSINGKMRTTMVISLEATKEEVEKIVLENEVVQKWVDGKPVKKIIFVKNKMVNIVV